MPTTRREFLKALGGGATALSFISLIDPAYAGKLQDAVARISYLPPDEAASDEDFWRFIRHSYTVSSNIINLNNGGVSPQPKIVQDAFEKYNRLSNEAPSYYMWRILDNGREPLRENLARLAGCSPEEIAINRNTTEALDTITFGLQLKTSDEVVLSRYDYPNMLNAWKQREKRDGIVLKWVELDMPMEDESVIVERFASQFTSRTRIVQITHIINYTGQILPVRAIADEAHKRGIEVIVDGAHTFAHLDFKIPDLHCDYFGTSLHKWLCAPFGTGMIYVKKEKIASLWPAYPHDNPLSDDIRKFEALGTRSFPTEQATGNALDFHLTIGSKRKEERLRYLKNYWMEKVRGIPGLHFFTSAKPAYACALATFGVERKEPTEIERFLFDKYKIHTSPIVWEKVKGVRITPHVYTSTADLDLLVEALKELTSSK